ncbi:MAG: SDR family NAD(P)-dependent oxidoreductase [Paracoccaceae bacterium]
MRLVEDVYREDLPLGFSDEVVQHIVDHGHGKWLAVFAIRFFVVSRRENGEGGRQWSFDYLVRFFGEAYRYSGPFRGTVDRHILFAIDPAALKQKPPVLDERSTHVTSHPMQRSLILGATGGIGAALMARLPEAIGLSRTDGLDWMKPEQAEQALIAAADDGPFDLIFDATGALTIDGRGPEKQLKTIDAAAMAAQFAVNAIGPALILKHHEALLARARRAVFATLSARVGSIGDNGLGGWISYRASKAALNQIVKTASIEITRKRPEAIVVALHPGTVATPLSDRFAGQRNTLSPDEAAASLLSVLGGLNAGDTGGFFAYDGTSVPW